MAAIYNNRTWNGKEEWRFRTKIQVIKGTSQFRFTPYLQIQLKPPAVIPFYTERKTRAFSTGEPSC
jgi:hypothetical protein